MEYYTLKNINVNIMLKFYRKGNNRFSGIETKCAEPCFLVMTPSHVFGGRQNRMT